MTDSSTPTPPKPIYACQGYCGCSWPARDIFWSPKKKKWICIECFDLDEYGEAEVSVLDALSSAKPDFTLANLWVSNYCCLAFGAPPIKWTEHQIARAHQYKLLIEAYTKWLNDPQEQELVKKHLK